MINPYILEERRISLACPTIPMLVSSFAFKIDSKYAHIPTRSELGTTTKDQKIAHLNLESIFVGDASYRGEERKSKTRCCFHNSNPIKGSIISELFYLFCLERMKAVLCFTLVLFYLSGLIAQGVSLDSFMILFSSRQLLM